MAGRLPGERTKVLQFTPMVKTAWPMQLKESVAVMVKVAVAGGPVGVPVTSPVVPFRVSPAGNEPEVTA